MAGFDNRFTLTAQVASGFDSLANYRLLPTFCSITDTVGELLKLHLNRYFSPLTLSIGNEFAKGIHRYALAHR